jgi:hypothetical protein
VEEVKHMVLAINLRQGRPDMEGRAKMTATVVVLAGEAAHQVVTGAMVEMSTLLEEDRAVRLIKMKS